MPTQINGSTGVSKVQDGSVTQADLAANVVGNGPAFLAENSSAQTVTSGVFTKALLGTEHYDTNNNFASGRFTPTVAGYYMLIAQLYGIGTTITNLGINIYKNGAITSPAISCVGPETDNASLQAAGLVYMNGTTDYVELFCRVTGTGTVAIGAGTNITTLFQGFLARAA